MSYRGKRSPCRTILGLPNDNAVGEKFFAVELEISLEACTPDQEREPMEIVGPHLIVRNLVERSPERDRFGGFLWFASEIVGQEDRAMQAVAVAKLEVQ